jgi:hypothetical protein
MLELSFSQFDPYRSSSALRWRCGAVTNVVFFKKCVRRGPKLREPYETTALIKLIAGSAVALPLDHRRHRSRRWRLEALNARRIKSPLETGESHVQ